MNDNVFIPKTLHVGFQERINTYTGKLAYIIYEDEKGEIRKEKSWNSWRDKEIEPLKILNEPISGFVLNKKAGGYASGWNHRQTYIRIYDPRDFEIEITVANLIYILEHTHSIKGKGLEGEFVYCFDKGEMWLMPVCSPDYTEIKTFNEQIYAQKKILAKDLIIGATYKTKKNENFIYLGKFDYYEKNNLKPKEKRHFFYDESGYYQKFVSYKSISGKFIDVVDEECAFNYTELFEELESKTCYSPYNPELNEYEPLEKQEWIDFVKEENKRFREDNFAFKNKHDEYIECRLKYIYGDKCFVISPVKEYYPVWSIEGAKRYGFSYFTADEIETIFEEIKPYKIKKYLSNGKPYYGRD